MGTFLLLFSAACFGAMAIFGKFAFEAGVSPGTLLLTRFTLAAVLLGALVLLRPPARRPAARVLAVAAGMGAVGYAAQAGFFFAALERMDATLLSLVLYTYPVMVTVAAVLLGRDRLTPGRVTALLAASAGTLLVLAGSGGTGFPVIGALLAFASALTYTAYILVADTVVHRLPPVLLTALVMAGAATTVGAGTVATGGPDLGFDPVGWLWLGAIAVVSTVLAALTFFAGLRRTGPSAAARRSCRRSSRWSRPRWRGWCWARR